MPKLFDRKPMTHTGKLIGWAVAPTETVALRETARHYRTRDGLAYDKVTGNAVVASWPPRSLEVASVAALA